MDYPALKGFALSSLTDHVVERVDRAGNTVPDFASVDQLVAWADRAGEYMLRDILNWQLKLATVVVMPKRSRRRRSRRPLGKRPGA